MLFRCLSSLPKSISASNRAVRYSPNRSRPVSCRVVSAIHRTRLARLGRRETWACQSGPRPFAEQLRQGEDGLSFPEKVRAGAAGSLVPVNFQPAPCGRGRRKSPVLSGWCAPAAGRQPSPPGPRSRTNPACTSGRSPAHFSWLPLEEVSAMRFRWSVSWPCSSLHNVQPAIVLCHAPLGLADDGQGIVVIQAQLSQVVRQPVPLAGNTPFLQEIPQVLPGGGTCSPQRQWTGSRPPGFPLPGSGSPCPHRFWCTGCPRHSSGGGAVRVPGAGLLSETPRSRRVQTVEG